MRWAVKRACLNRMLVTRDNILKSIHTRVEDISVQCKTMRCSLIVRRDSTTEPIESDLLVAVVVLQNLTYVSDCLQVLVAVGVEVVKRAWLRWVSVGKCEVYGNG